MRRTIARLTLGLAWSIALVAGCGTDSMAPATGPGSPPLDVPETAKTIFMITSDPPDAEPEGWVVLAMREANRERMIFRVFGPGPGESPASQPELIRRAMLDGASALVVVAGDAPGLPAALAEAESKGIPVVIIGPTIAPPEGSPPFTNVVPRPFDASAERLVQAAMRDAKTAGLPPDGAALILVDRGGGAYSVDRTIALEAAATRAGLKVRLVEFDPPAESPSAAEATRTILEALDLTILLAMDEPGMQLATKARKTLAPRAKVFVAGYASHQNAMMTGVYGLESAFVDYKSEEMGRLAVQAVLGRLRGEGPGRKVEYDPGIRRGLASDPRGLEVLKPIVNDRDPPRPPAEPKKAPQ